MGTSSQSLALSGDEHRGGTEAMFDSVMVLCEFNADGGFEFILDDDRKLFVPERIDGESTLGQLCARFAKDDAAVSRYHIKGWSILNQLRLLDAQEIATAWDVHARGEVRLAEISNLNVVANYLLHHIVALKLAERAGANESSSDLRRALMYEAMAVGYLQDAMSSGHMMVPLTDSFQFMHPTNNRKTHDAFSNDGVYVMNSKGEVWLTFGDKVSLWYYASRKSVERAMQTSLKELLLVFLAAGSGDLPAGLEEWTFEHIGLDWQDVVIEWTEILDGVAYYSDLNLPTLMLMPMPISATWSTKTGGYAGSFSPGRFHYPQLADSGYHDPSLGEGELDALYRRVDMPRWLVFSTPRKQGVEETIKNDKDVASVRYLQRRSYKPAYSGGLASVSTGWASNQTGDGIIVGVGLGYGLLDDFTAIKKVSVNFDVYPGYDDRDRLILSPSMQFALQLPTASRWQVVRNGRFELGWAWSVREPFVSDGFRFGWGLEPGTIPLGFTNAGVTFRFKYQWLFLDETKQGLQLELVLH